MKAMTNAKKVQILKRLNDTAAEFPIDKTLHQLFAEQAVKTPGNTAVIFKNKKLTYRELNEKTDQLARLLQSKGVGSDSVVGIKVERSLEMMIGLLAILKAGGAYLPIDPHYPEERIHFMLADSGAIVLLKKSEIRISKSETNSNDQNANDRNKGNVPIVLNFEHLNFDIVSNFVLRASNLSSSELAYVIYTSGSTGKPKGVMIEHRSVVNRLHWMQKKYPLTENDVILQKTPYFFDVSVWELFWWLLAGAAVCFLLPGFERFPQAIVETVEKNNVTTMHFVPSMMSAFLGYIENSGDAERLGSLKQVFCSGEELKPSHVNRFNKILYQRNGTRLINLYGPTEATVDVSYFDCPTGTDIQQVPIGKPIDNTGLYIMDKDMHVLPVGTEGELYISGVGLARGYLNRPELTADRFCLRRPGEEKKGTGKFFSPFTFHLSPFYKTGDLAYWLPDGNIVYCGRMDYQVKIRGLRIELGEIESVLSQHPDVRDCVVIVKQTTETIINLIAYIVMKTDEQVSFEALKKYMKSFLPDYMIPGEFVILKTLPLTPSGKVDRKALG